MTPELTINFEGYEPEKHAQYVLYALNFASRNALAANDGTTDWNTADMVAANWHNGLIHVLNQTQPLEAIDLAFSYQLRGLIRAASYRHSWVALLNVLNEMLTTTKSP